MSRFLTKKDLMMAKYRQEVLNSQVKRGLVDKSVLSQTVYIVCGCGEKGCGFIRCYSRDKK